MYVLCTTAETAVLLARMIRAGRIPNLYRTEAVAVEAWQSQPSPMRTRYRIWRIVGSCAVSFKRVDRKPHQQGEPQCN